MLTAETSVCVIVVKWTTKTGAFHAIGVNQDWDGAVPAMPSNSFNHAPSLSVLQAARPEPLLDMVEMSGFGSC